MIVIQKFDKKILKTYSLISCANKHAKILPTYINRAIFRMFIVVPRNPWMVCYREI